MIYFDLNWWRPEEAANGIDTSGNFTCFTLDAILVIHEYSASLCARVSHIRIKLKVRCQLRYQNYYYRRRHLSSSSSSSTNVVYLFNTITFVSSRTKIYWTVEDTEKNCINKCMHNGECWHRHLRCVATVETQCHWTAEALFRTCWRAAHLLLFSRLHTQFQSVQWQSATPFTINRSYDYRANQPNILRQAALVKRPYAGSRHLRRVSCCTRTTTWSSERTTWRPVVDANAQLSAVQSKPKHTLICSAIRKRGSLSIRP